MAIAMTWSRLSIQMLHHSTTAPIHLCKWLVPEALMIPPLKLLAKAAQALMTVAIAITPMATTKLTVKTMNPKSL